MQPDLAKLERCFRTGQYLITQHGFEEMGDDNITIAMLEKAVADDDPEIIEDYPDDVRGASCLILGWCKPDEPIHVCVGYAEIPPVVITVYVPTSDKFEVGFRRRKKRNDCSKT